MDGTSEVQALEKIANEVDESQVKVILASQCIKAQTYLVDKLKKQSERQKEVCGFIRNGNLQLEAEINQGEHEIKSLLIAQETLRSANIELRKEVLLAKEKKPAITQRIENGVRKYEAVWLESKKRFESIPFVQTFLQVTERKDELKTEIDNLDHDIQNIYEETKTRREACLELDRKRVIELAKFVIEELPKITKIIDEKTRHISDLKKQIEDMLKEQGDDIIAVMVRSENERNALNAEDSQFGGGIPLIPALKLSDFDFNSIEIDLDRAKKRVTDNVQTTEPLKMNPILSDLETNKNDHKMDDFIISPYFHKPAKEENFSRKKLINILEDVKIDRNEAYNIIAKVNPAALEAVDVISADDKNQKKNEDIPRTVNEDTEVIDVTASNKENIIIPPTQFLDLTLQASQERGLKKVSFDLTNTVKTPEVNIENKAIEEEGNKLEQTIDSQLNASGDNDESFSKIKDMIMKKHNLDLSPQFVYAKNNLPKKLDEGSTSKFFKSDAKTKVDEQSKAENKMDTDVNTEAVTVALVEPVTAKPHDDLIPIGNTPNENVPMEVDDVIVGSAKPNEDKAERIMDKPISGLLFTHGLKAIPDSLDVSISTTGYDDSDFPHCMDTSLMLSPKADVPMTGENNEILSQEVPNFLSGLRKTGLSFFGAGPSTEPNPESGTAQNAGNSFSFNFGGAEKKSRGGLFSMFR